MAIELEKVVLDDLLPDSIAKDDGVAAAAKAIDPQLQIASGFVDIPSIYVSIDRQSSTALDHLATQYDVSVWRDTWPLAVKRSVLKTAIADKRRKGTVEAVKQALASVSSAAVIREWWQKTPRGEPHTFEIVATMRSAFFLPTARSLRFVRRRSPWFRKRRQRNSCLRLM